MESTSDVSMSGSSDDNDDDDHEVVMLINTAFVIDADYNESDSDDSSESSNKWGGSPLFTAHNILRDFEGAYIDPPPPCDVRCMDTCIAWMRIIYLRTAHHVCLLRM